MYLSIYNEPSPNAFIASLLALLYASITSPSFVTILIPFPPPPADAAAPAGQDARHVPEQQAPDMQSLFASHGSPFAYCRRKKKPKKLLKFAEDAFPETGVTANEDW